MSDVNPWQQPPQPPEGPGTSESRPAGFAPQPLADWASPQAGAPSETPGAPGGAAQPLVPAPRRRARLFGAAALAVVLVGGGAGASVALSSGSSGGAPTPAQAVDDMLQSIQRSDVVGFLDDLAPGERDAIAPGLQDIFGQLKRIGVLSSGADLAHVSGLSYKFHGYATTTQQINSTLAAVDLSGGNADASVDPNQLPLGSYFKSLAITATTGQVKSSSSPMNTTTLATVQVNGSWYVSLGYSIAINDLKSAGRSMAPPVNGITPAGAPSPQGAVKAFFGSVSNLDLQQLIADLDPGEMAALDAYAPLLVGQAQQTLNAAKASVSITFDLPAMTTQQISGGTLVKIGSGLGVHVKAGTTSIDIANGCETVTMNASTVHTCGATGGLANMSAERRQLVQDMPAAVRPILQRFIDSPPDVGFVTSQVNGKWYISPTRTLLQAVNAYLADLAPGDIQTVIANANGVGQGFSRFLKKQEQSILGAAGPLGALGAGAFSLGGSTQ